MSEYAYINNFSNRGKIGISYNIFDFLVNSSLKNFSNIQTSSKMLKRNQNVRLNRPIRTTIHHGIVHIWIAIDVKKGSNIQEIIKLITDDINSTLLTNTEQIPFDVQVKVESLI